MEELKKLNKNIESLKNGSTLDFLKFCNIMENYKTKFNLNNNKLNELFDILSDDNSIHSEDLKNLLNSLKEFLVIELKKKYISDNLKDKLFKEIENENINLEQFEMIYNNEDWFNFFRFIYDERLTFIENIKDFFILKKLSKSNDNIVNYLNKYYENEEDINNDIFNNNSNNNKLNNIISSKKITKFDYSVNEFKEILLKISRLIEKLDNVENKFKTIEEIFNLIDELELKIDKIIEDSKNYKSIIKDLKNKLKNWKMENQKIQFLIRRESLNNESEIKIWNLKNQLNKKNIENEKLQTEIDILKEKNNDLNEKLDKKDKIINKMNKDKLSYKKNIETLNYDLKVINLKLDNKNEELKKLKKIIETEEDKKFEEINKEKNKNNLLNNSIIEDLNKDKKDLSMKIIELNGKVINLSNVVNNYENELNHFKTLNEEEIKSIRESLVLEANNDYLSIIKNNFQYYIFTDFCFLKKDNKFILCSIKLYQNIIELKEVGRDKKINICKNDINVIYHIIEDNFIKIYYENNKEINIYILKNKEFWKLINLEIIHKIESLYESFTFFSYFNNIKYNEIIFVKFNKNTYLNLLLIYNDILIFIKFEKIIKNFDKKKLFFKKELSITLDKNKELISLKYNNSYFEIKHLNYDQLLKIYDYIKN